MCEVSKYMHVLMFSSGKSVFKYVCVLAIKVPINVQPVIISQNFAVCPVSFAIYTYRIIVVDGFYLCTYAYICLLESPIIV